MIRLGIDLTLIKETGVCIIDTYRKKVIGFCVKTLWWKENKFKTSQNINLLVEKICKHINKTEYVGCSIEMPNFGDERFLILGGMLIKELENKLNCNIKSIPPYSWQKLIGILKNEPRKITKAKSIEHARSKGFVSENDNLTDAFNLAYLFDKININEDYWNKNYGRTKKKTRKGV